MQTRKPTGVASQIQAPIYHTLVHFWKVQAFHQTGGGQAGMFNKIQGRYNPPYTLYKASTKTQHDYNTTQT